jgi:DNA excision repair protein ERCC-2
MAHPINPVPAEAIVGEAGAGTTAPAPAADGSGPSYTVSVRSLCEFTAKRGDLDRRFTPSATALEGINGQAAVAARRGADYQRELALEGRFGLLRVRGRADGYDPARSCLEEVKTIRGDPDEIPDNRRQLHWAQLETYGALLCRARGLVEVHLALVYVDAATQGETVLRQLSSAAELEAAFVARCERFLAWARQEAEHRVARDAALGQLMFPPGAFRPGQRTLAEAVYRAAVGGRCLLAQAPTGIGKTLGTLYPMLRAMPGQRLDKIAYLTCKGTGRVTALDGLHRLREGAAGRSLRVLALVAKEQACEHPDKACHGDACPLARGFYDRLPAARSEAVAAGWLDPAAQRVIALRHGICPYYLGQELLRWADVVVGDVYHQFDPNGQLHGLAQALDWRIGLLVDEAHNLVERGRQMYSSALSLGQIRAALQLAPTALRGRFGRLVQAAEQLAAEQLEAYAAYDAVPEAFAQALQGLVAALGEYLHEQPLATGPLLGFHFEAVRLQRLIDGFGEHSLFDMQRSDDDPADASFCLRNVVPAPFLRPRLAACSSATLFSATLAPPHYQRDMLGLPEDSAWLDVPPAFAPEHLSVRIADRVSTRYADRAASLDAVVALMARQFAEQPGNYLAFFSSFEYLERAADRLTLRHPTLVHWRQSRAMGEGARQAFLARFEADGQGIGFAVLGGAFAEGIDLPGTRLIGAFIATLGLPPVNPVQSQMRARLDALFGAGHGYADRVPGLQKVVQAAGRVIRTPEDRGWVCLMDDRYRRSEVRALLPAWWRIDRASQAGRDGPRRWRDGAERGNIEAARRPPMKPDPTPTEGEFSKLVDEQLELAAARIPALSPTVVHPSPVDHEERSAAHANFEDVLLGNAEPSPEMLEELAALEAAPELSEEELARQALADGGADDDPATPE